MIGQVIGNYRVVAELGKGGMGMVYRAEHVQLGRPAALKMLLPQFSTDSGIVQRFFNEARAASGIDHPGIVEIYDFGTHTDGRAYIVMALLKGESLEHRLQRGPLPPLEGATILAQVVAALGAAHARGIVHRDLKPDNIYLVPNELVAGGMQVKLLDFGIAKLADEQTAGFKTQTGALMGTPAYMSPEQCMGKPDLDHRTDIYSIGCILFHVLCGRPPFTSDEGTGMMIAAHIRDPAPDPRTINPHVPPALVSIIMRCLEKEPAARFQSAAELRNALVAAGANAPLSKPPMSAEQYAPTLAPSPVPSQPPVSSTTHGHGAAQMISQPPTKPKSKAPVVIGVGLLLAGVAGAGIFVAANQKDDKPATAASQPSLEAKPATPPPPEAKPPEAKPPEAKPTQPDPTQVAGGAPAVPPPPEDRPVPECPPGQTRREDTKGQCCWPEQAWSDSKSRCVGKPKCPDGTAAKGDTCIAVAVSPTQRPPKHDPLSTQPTGNATFTLTAASFAPGADVLIKFPSAMASPDRNRSWVTIVTAGRPPSAYEVWEYVKDGASSMVLKAPTKEGPYEVRLHTDYPTKSFNVRHTVAITVGAAQIANDNAPDGPTPLGKQKFRLQAKVVPAGANAKLEFPQPMKAVTGEQFWVTVVEKGASADAYKHYEYVPDGARGMKIAVPTTPGEYEVRLHANYPTKATNLVHRQLIRVEPGP